MGLEMTGNRCMCLFRLLHRLSTTHLYLLLHEVVQLLRSAGPYYIEQNMNVPQRAFPFQFMSKHGSQESM